jgi:hypothetical protein
MKNNVSNTPLQVTPVSQAARAEIPRSQRTLISVTVSTPCRNFRETFVGEELLGLRDVLSSPCLGVLRVEPGFTVMSALPPLVDWAGAVPVSLTAADFDGLHLDENALRVLDDENMDACIRNLLNTTTFMQWGGSSLTDRIRGKLVGIAAAGDASSLELTAEFAETAPATR